MKYKDFLSFLLNNKNKHQQRQLLAGIEWLVGIKFGNLLSRYSIILKQLYDEDLIEEEVLLEWYYDENINEYTMNKALYLNDNERIFEQLKESAKLFIKWLEEAEEEDDDDAEGEEDAEEGVIAEEE